MRPRQFILGLMALCCLAPAIAQAAGPQTATYSAKLNTSALQVGQTAVAAIVVDIKPGLHAQSHTPLMGTGVNYIQFQVMPDPNPNVEFLDPIYPPGQIIRSPALGPQNVYTGRVIVYVPMRVKTGAAVGETTISGKLTWQACNDRACFAPSRNQPFEIATQIVPAEVAVTLKNQSIFTHFDQRVFARNAPTAASVPATGTTVDFFGRTFELGASNIWLALAIALAVGVLFNLMPCVLPVVPLKAIGFFEVSRHNRARCLMLGAVFSLGVIAVFAALAVLIVALRTSLHFSWGEQFKYGWFIWAIVVILVVMALGMFGLFEVVLPNSVYSLAPSHESVWGNFVFGILAAVLSTPCTAPMFAGLLAWATAQPIYLGVSVVITVGVGMALPYLILSAFPNLARWVPRTGPWSAMLKQMMGFLLLAVAVYFAGGRLVSSRDFFWAVFAVVALAMVFLIVRTIQLSRGVRPKLVSLAIAGLSIWISLTITLRLTGGIAWQPYSNDAFAAAIASGKPVLVEFTANWCPNCLSIEASVYHDPRTAAALHKDNVVLLRADLTDENAPGWPKVYELNPGGGIPLTAIYGPHDDRPVAKLTSLYSAQNLIDAVNRATRF
ncbi:MAG TPA: cytochrome c biogenesis protein CcdA [Tepidisphaeraceae bacterium]|nr:cytochrome c biogenesis protein CcdA [Tepidisphaeraceae bacterium]